MGQFRSSVTKEKLTLAKRISPSSYILVEIKECMTKAPIKFGMSIMTCGFEFGLSYGGTIMSFD